MAHYMKKTFAKNLLIACCLILMTLSAYAEVIIYTNQVGFDNRGPKLAVIQTDLPVSGKVSFTVVEVATGKTAFRGWLGAAQQIADWAPGKWFYPIDFALLKKPGKYTIHVVLQDSLIRSAPITI